MTKEELENLPMHEDTVTHTDEQEVARLLKLLQERFADIGITISPINHTLH